MVEIHQASCRWLDLGQVVVERGLKIEYLRLLSSAQPRFSSRDPYLKVVRSCTRRATKRQELVPQARAESINGFQVFLRYASNRTDAHGRNLKAFRKCL